MCRCILTGLGNRGRYWHGQLKGRDDVEVVAYVDSSAPMRHRAIAELGIAESSLFDHFDKALAAVAADFVLDVTPPSVHEQIAARTFDAGLHLLSEKPLSDDYQAAVRIVEAGRRAGRKHMIAQNYRFNAPVRTLRKLLDQQIIGTVGQCDVQFYKAWADAPGTHYVTEPYMAIKDMMIHHFDLIRYLLGVDPLWVQAITWNHPWGWHRGDAAHAIVFGFPDRVMATHVTVACSVGDSHRDYFGAWRLDGSDGSITMDNQRLRHVHLARTDEPIDNEMAPAEPVGDIVTEFLAAIDADCDPECCAADNLKSMAMVFAAIQSAEHQQKVLLEEIEGP